MLIQSCIFSHPVVNFSALMLEAYLLKICRAMPRAILSFFALIKCARAIFHAHAYVSTDVVRLVGNAVVGVSDQETKAMVC